MADCGDRQKQRERKKTPIITTKHEKGTSLQIISILMVNKRS